MTTKAKQAPSAAVSLTMPKALPAAELVKAIDSHHKATAKGIDTYQVLGVQCLMHLKAHRDIGPCNRLLAGMPSGTNRRGMGQWLLAYGALSVSQNQATRKEAPLAFDKSKETKPEEAMADHWKEYNASAMVLDEFDLQKALHGLLQKAKGKTIKLHGKVLSVSHAVDALKTLAAMAGEDNYVPEVNQLADGQPARRAEDKAGTDSTTQAADAPKDKATPKRLLAAA